MDGALAALEGDDEGANAAHYAAGAGHAQVLQVLAEYSVITQRSLNVHSTFLECSLNVH
jgi:hypothetical protein